MLQRRPVSIRFRPAIPKAVPGADAKTKPPTTSCVSSVKTSGPEAASNTVPAKQPAPLKVTGRSALETVKQIWVDASPLGVRLTKMQGEVICTQIINPQISPAVHGMRVEKINGKEISSDWDAMVSAIQLRPLEITFSKSKVLSEEALDRLRAAQLAYSEKRLQEHQLMVQQMAIRAQHAAMQSHAMAHQALQQEKIRAEMAEISFDDGLIDDVGGPGRQSLKVNQFTNFYNLGVYAKA